MQTRKQSIDSVLAQQCAKAGVTTPGLEWLKVALDPFHDSDTYCTGYPDINVAPSLVQAVKKTVSVACPSGISGNWDAHVIMSPVINDATGGVGLTALAQNMSTQQNLMFKNGTLTTGAPFPSGLTVWAGAEGQNLEIDNTSIYPIAQINPDDSYLKGTSRVIAMGFETTNTTSELYKQGQVISYRNPVPQQNSSSWGLATLSSATPPVATLSGIASVVPITEPPDNAAAALLLAGSRQWAAKDGVYSVSTLNSTVIPPSGEDFQLPMFHAEDDDAEQDSQAFIPLLESSEDFSLPWTAPREMYIAPFNQSGAYFTGLSQQTTLNLTAVWYIERFPSSEDTDLCVLAKPAPTLDVKAQQVYGAAITSLPPGVTVSENGLGDWFASAVSKVADFVSPVAGLIPGGGLAVGAAKMASSLWGAPTASSNSIVPIGRTNELFGAPISHRPPQARMRSQKIPQRKKAPSTVALMQQVISAEKEEIKVLKQALSGQGAPRHRRGKK